MVSYLDRLGKPIVEVFEVKGRGHCYNKGDLFTLAEIVPAHLCPFAYYNMTPYITTLFNNGWFRWVRREGNGSSRKTPLAEQFRDSYVNSAFPNEVLVQCPNPHVSVVMGVGPEGEGAVRVRVLYQESPCPAGHSVGDEFRVREGDTRIPPSLYSTLFPYILLSGSRKGSLVRGQEPQEDTTFRVCQHPEDLSSFRTAEEIDVCFPYNRQAVKAATVKSPCRYHTAPTAMGRVSPEGMCLSAFHTAYPYSLGLLYDAKFVNGGGGGPIRLRCPNPRGGVELEVKRVPTTSSVVRLLKGIGARVFELISRPVDVIDHKIVYTICGVQGTCPARHRVGEEFEFNLWSKEELCPASFHSLYPYLFLKDRGDSFGWQEGEALSEVSCPDCQGAVYQF
ncbi:MAG TPA: TIGR04076 family protein [Candidatus Tripitaka californicus]|uniref:TIGR04076 family protein n=2 Tax=Candidatus Tripitaka californicus TaxID=3367616 RepID=UPI004028A98E